MAFVKGKSGNPNGRPKKTPELLEIETLAKEASPQAIERIVKLLKSDDERIALMAANSILDRAYGKPQQAIEHKGRVTHDVSNLSDADLAAIVAGAIGGGRDPAAKKDQGRLH